MIFKKGSSLTFSEVPPGHGFSSLDGTQAFGKLPSPTPDGKNAIKLPELELIECPEVEVRYAIIGIDFSR